MLQKEASAFRSMQKSYNESTDDAIWGQSIMEIMPIFLLILNVRDE